MDDVSSVNVQDEVSLAFRAKNDSCDAFQTQDENTSDSRDDHETYDAEGIEDNLLGDAREWAFHSLSPEGADFHAGLQSHRPKQTVLLYNHADKLLLKKASQEVKFVCDQVQSSTWNLDNSTALKSFAACLPRKFFSLLDEWLQRNSDGNIRWSTSYEQLVQFFKIEILLRAHQISAVSLKRNARHYNVLQEEIECHERIRSIFEKADTPHPNHSLDPALVSFMADCRALWTKKFFCDGVTWIDMDQDELPFISESWDQFGIRDIRAKDSARKPVVHLFCSVTTGLILSPTVEKLETKPAEIISKSISSIQESVSPNLDRNKLMVLVDRNYFALARARDPARRTNIVRLLQDLKVDFMGCPKDSSTFPFETFDGDPEEQGPPHQKNKVMVSSTGKRAAFDASKLSNGLCATLTRHGQGRPKFSKLVTSDARLVANRWDLETAAGQDFDGIGEVKRAPQKQPSQPLHPSADGHHRLYNAYNTLESNVYVMTAVGKQHGQDWQLAQLYRASSRPTHELIDCLAAPYIDTDFLKDLHVKVKQIAQLKSTKDITFESASSKEDNSVNSEQGGSRSRRGDQTSFEYWKRNRNRDHLLEKARELGLVADPSSTKDDLGKLIANHFARKNISSSSSSSSSSSTTPSSNGQTELDGTLEDSRESMVKRQVSFLQILFRIWFADPPLKLPRMPSTPLHTKNTNEGYIAEGLSNFVFSKSGGRYSIASIKEYGLLANRAVPFAADTPDEVGALFSRSVGGNLDTFLGLVALVFKPPIEGRKSSDPRLGSWSECDAGSEAFLQLVPDSYIRTQIIHHAAVLNLEASLLIFSSPSELQLAVLVRVSPIQRSTWLSFLKTLSERWMSFAYNDVGPGRFPRLGKDYSGVYGFAREHHTAEQYLQLWFAHSRDVICNGTPPQCIRMFPEFSSLWNKVMGSVEMAKKIMTHPRAVYKGLSPTSLLWMTFFDYLLHNAFRLHQIVLIKSSIDSFMTFKEYVDARASDTNYTAFLFTLAEWFSAGTIPIAMPILTQQQLWEDQRERSGNSDSVEESSKGKKRQRRIVENLDITDNQLRLDNSSPHVIMRNPPNNRGFAVQRRCILCCTTCEKEAEDGVRTVHTRAPRQTTKRCSRCEVALCKKCFFTYHSAEVLEVPYCRQKHGS